MTETQAIPEAVLEVVSPDGARRFVRITQTPFLIGRGAETGNHLQLTDRRISRQCGAIVFEGGRFYLEDRGQRRGLFVNDEKVDNRELADKDSISFGLADSYELIFRWAAGKSEDALSGILNRIEQITRSDDPSQGLGKLNRVLDAMMLLHSQLPLDSVIEQMLEHAVSVTDADRGVLLVPDSTHGVDGLRVQLARRRGGGRLSPEGISPSHTAIRLALDQRASVITEDLAQADADLQAAQSIVAQRLRSVIVIPLYPSRGEGGSSSEPGPGRANSSLLGVLYLDSTRPAAFTRLDRQILDALSLEAASILDNARLVERERGRQRMEQEMSIARDIQQALLPHGFQDYPHMAVSGVNFPCLSVGGDYFDVFPIGDGRTAFLIADVSGKGLGAALLTTMLQGALSGMSLGTDPARVFNHINRFLCEHAEVGRYATMFFAVLGNDGRLEFINAGHPSPILIRAGNMDSPFTEGSFPVGLVPDANYVAAHLKLEPEDTLVLFSDGVTEAMDPNEELYGVPRLLEALSGTADTPLEQIQNKILESVQTFSRGASQADDLTLLLVRYRAAGARAGSEASSASSASA
jgi:sigma-B regulation protein RsbU (phosphoserine phosphatase)